MKTASRESVLQKRYQLNRNPHGEEACSYAIQTKLMYELVCEHHVDITQQDRLPAKVKPTDPATTQS